MNVVDFERLGNALETFYAADELVHERFFRAADEVCVQLQASLPALCEADQAAVAYYIAQLVTALRDLPMRSVSDVISDTAIGYTLTSAKLFGMLREPGKAA
jgi:hypothetical protein